MLRYLNVAGVHLGQRSQLLYFQIYDITSRYKGGFEDGERERGREREREIDRERECGRRGGGGKRERVRGTE